MALRSVAVSVSRNDDTYTEHSFFDPFRCYQTVLCKVVDQRCVGRSRASPRHIGGVDEVGSTAGGASDDGDYELVERRNGDEEDDKLEKGVPS